MADTEKRPEATHRQRADLAHGVPGSLPYDAEGNPMAIVIGTASDLVPTVQFGNILVGPVSIIRPVPNGTMEEITAAAREVQKATEFVVGAERRIIQWALDPSSRVVNPSTGEVVTPNGDVPGTEVAPVPPPPPSEPPALGTPPATPPMATPPIADPTPQA